MADYQYGLECSIDVNKENDSGQTALHIAVSHDDLETVKYLLNHGADVNKKTRSCLPEVVETKCDCSNIKHCFHKNDEFGNEMKGGDVVAQNALHLAAKHGSAELVELLLPFVGNINEPSEDNSTALHYATQNRVDDDTDVRVAQLLLKHGADLEARNRDGKTPLYLAVKLEKLRLVEFLLSVGANPNASTLKLSTPLYSALINENVELTSLLLKHGAMASGSRNHQDDEPLFYALRILDRGNSRLRIVSLLLDAGVDSGTCNSQGSTALHEAVKDDDEALVRLLLERGYSPSAKNSCNMSPLALAVKDKKAMELARLLLEEGAPADDYCNDVSLLKLAVTERDEDMVRLLLEHGAAAKGTYNCYDDELLLCALPLVRNQRGVRLRIVSLLLDARIKSQASTALHVAVADGDAALARLLLERGCLPGTKNQFNIPSQSAALQYSKFADVIRILHLRGVPFGKYFKYASMLEYATKHCNEAMVRVLLEHGAPAFGYCNPSEKKPVCYPLGMAVQAGNTALARLMLELGCPPAARSPTNMSPLLEHAVKHGNVEMARVLLEHGVDVNGCSGLLNYAVDRSNEGIVRLLLEKGVAIPCGMLKYAISKCACDEAIVRLLLDHGVDVNFGSDGDKPIIVASMKGNERIMKMLIAAGADIDYKDSNGRTSLMIATQYASFEVMRYLIDHGAKLNEQDNEGNTALHILLLMKVFDTIGREMSLEPSEGKKHSKQSIELSLARVCALAECTRSVKNHFSQNAGIKSQGIKNFIKDFIETFLEAGADINIENEKGHTPFRYMRSNRFEKHEKMVFLKHIALLLTLGKHVNPVNLSYIKDNSIWSENLKVYLQELERMKVVNVFDEYSYLRVITDVNYSQLISLFREKDALMLFKECIKINDFKNYIDLLLKYFSKKYERFTLMKRAAYLLSEIFQSKLPPEVAEKIAEHLSNRAMKELINDFKLLSALNM